MTSVGDWIEGKSVRDLEPGAEDALRAEVKFMAETLDLLRHSLGKIGVDLDAESRASGETYSADAFLRGYHMGKARQSAVVGSTLAALGNSIVTRMGAKR